jgi:G3E family GTPase
LLPSEQLNIDSQLLAGGVGVPGADAAASVVAQDSLVALSNGCICCTLRDDLLEQVSLLAAQGRFDYLLIESTGISEPAPVAATFTARGSGGGTLAQYAPLDSMLTVVDASRFADDFACGELLAARGLAAHDADGRAVAGLLAAQVECADTIVLNKCDLVCDAHPDGARRLDAAEAALRALNPRARLLRAVRCELPVRELLHTGRFDAAAEEAAGGDAAAAAWAEERAAAAAGRPAAGHVSEADAYDIRSVSFTARRPFHPARLWAAVFGADAAAAAGASAANGIAAPLIRSKGFFWLASRPGIAWSWSTAGAGAACAEFGPAAQWRADALPRELWPSAADDASWDATWGDRGQQLVLIGAGGAPDVAAAALRACLLSDEEMAAGEDAWETAFAGAHAATWGSRELTAEEVAALAHGEPGHVHTEACAAGGG